MTAIYSLKKLTRGYIYEYIKSQKRYFEQKRGKLKTDIFTKTISMKFKT